MSLSQTENILKDISNNEASTCSAVSASQSTTKLVESDTVKNQNSAQVQGHALSFSFHGCAVNIYNYNVYLLAHNVLRVSFHCLWRYFQSGVIERHWNWPQHILVMMIIIKKHWKRSLKDRVGIELANVGVGGRRACHSAVMLILKENSFIFWNLSSHSANDEICPINETNHFKT